MNNERPLLEDLQDCEVFILDYYDGPTSGAMFCQSHHQAYCFTMLDWDSKHDVRIFSLFPLPDSSFQEFVNALSHPDPVGDPEQDYFALKQLLDTTKDEGLIIARRNSDDKVLVVRKLDDQDVFNVMEWFSEPTSSRDWFMYLGLPK